MRFLLVCTVLSLAIPACDSQPTRAPDTRMAVSTDRSKKPFPDGDGDGWSDARDACPAAPGRAPDGCPPVDRAGDGRLAHPDRCPDGFDATPEGCRIRDSDGDGLNDPEDACVKLPENFNGYLDDDGCPDAIPHALAPFTGAIKGIYFDANKATIKRKPRGVLDNAVDVLQDHPQIRIEISGHTDNRGSAVYNQELSERRAEAVKQYLVEQGVDGARIETRGAGMDEPICCGSGGCRPDILRRIEFTIVVQ